jgi:hypothetical protein
MHAIDSMEESTESRQRQQPVNKRSRTNDDGVAASSSSSNDVGTDGGMPRSRDDVDDGTNNNEVSVLHPISPHVLSRTNELISSYMDNLPYPHGIIRKFCRRGFLENVLDELKNHTKVTFKETDLFRVYQSIDLVSFEIAWKCSSSSSLSSVIGLFGN